MYHVSTAVDQRIPTPSGVVVVIGTNFVLFSWLRRTLPDPIELHKNRYGHTQRIIVSVETLNIGPT
jgi:hypothetical protein